MKIYISGPISGYNLNERKAAFGKVQEYLLNKGYKQPVNPFSSEVKSYSDYMRADLKLLLDCDAIFLMNGWNHSKGCIAERNVAEICGMKIIKEEYVCTK